MNNKFLISIIIFSFISVCGFAQGRILSTVEANPSARNAGMGNAMLGNTDQMYLYVNPASFLFNQQKLSVDLSTDIYPKSEAGRLMQYNLSGGIKLNSKNAIFVGARNQRGLTIPSTSSLSAVGEIKPCEWTADLGYAFSVTPEVVVYGSGSYFQSVMNTKTQGWALSVGFGYQKELSLGGTQTLLTIGARLLDAGKPVKYGETGLPYDLPTSVVIGGDWEFNFSENHQLVYALSGRYFAPKNSKELHIGTGLEYTFHNLVSARVGYQYGKKSADRFTFGLGVKYSKVKFNVAYGNTSDIYGVNTLMVGLGFNL